jgi:hypothetical protein
MWLREQLENIEAFLVDLLKADASHPEQEI